MNAKQFEILEHTGDAKIQAFGKTKEELFLNAMLGMKAVLNPKLEIRNSKRVRRALKVNSLDTNALLVDFLSEANYPRVTYMEIYDKVNFVKFSNIELEAELEGYEVEESGEDINAVAFYGLDIHQNKEGIWGTPYCI